MVFSMGSIEKFLQAIPKNIKLVKEKNQYVYNLACSFDIETTSFYTVDGVIYTNEQIKKTKPKNAEKRAIMYIWQFAINDNVIYGRYWYEFENLLNRIKEQLTIGNRKLIIYVHNLSYEFQFLCKRFKWVDIFADSERKPIKAETETGFIFKCSYRLSGYSLEVLAKNLKNKTIKKLVGDLDYTKLRNSKTVLSDEELQYCVNDVLIVTAYINEQIEEYGTIGKIPLTQTGKVRKYVRRECFKNKQYRYLIKDLTIEPLEYLLLKNAFCGGFTHCNAMHTEQVKENVTSYDFTSSYPTVLISEKYPMSKGKKIKVETIQELKKIINKYACICDLLFEKIESTFLYDNIISVSKCRKIENARVNNGRLISADKIALTVTDIDFLNIEKFYKWDSCKIGVVYIYKRDYLPKEIIQTILQLYKDKTELKGVVGKEIEYLHSKELLNSIYGMCVTSIVHDTIDFDGEKWNTTENQLNAELDIYNTDKNRFLFYQWGVWCTAYARNNLYTAILECKNDYIYSDTDSVKILNAEKHKRYFDRYNEYIINKLETTLKHYNLPVELIRPKTIKGVEKPLGVWDFDGFYTRFKTLGAKRYIYEHNGDLSITVCGLAKKRGKEYIKQQKQPFLYFNNGMYVDSEHTGKMIHTYIDDEITGTLTDYNGVECSYNEKSYIHLENTDYVLSLTRMYIDYYTGLQKLYK